MFSEPLEADIEARLNGEYLWGRHCLLLREAFISLPVFIAFLTASAMCRSSHPGIDKPTFGEYNPGKCDTGRFDITPLSLRIPPEKEKIINRAAAKAGKTKSAFILEAVDEKLGLVKDRERNIRELAGWLPSEEAKKLRESLRVFTQIHEGDWD